MAYQSSEELLAGFLLFAKRPEDDESLGKPEIYSLLEQAQAHCYEIMAAHVPEVLYSAPTIMVTTDNKVFTFASAIHPMGSVEIRSSRTGNLLIPGTEWDVNADFVWEGSQIRIPNNKTRTFPDGAPYARYIVPASTLDQDNEPTLKPARARPAILWYALYLWAEIGGGTQQTDPNRFLGMFQSTLFGDPRMPGDIGIIGELKRQGYGKGMAAVSLPEQPWWLGSPDLG